MKHISPNLIYKNLFISLLAILLIGCTNTNQTNQPTTTPTSMPTPTSNSNQPDNQLSPSTPTSQTEIPTDWTWVSDSSVNVRMAYPSNWNLQPSLSSTGELSVTSFDPQTSPDTGGVPADEIKVAVVYFDPTDNRQVDFQESNIVSEERISVDNFGATKRELTGAVGTSISVEVELGVDNTYLITAYPADTAYMDEFDQLLSYIDLQAPTPVTITSIEPSQTVTSPVTVSGQILGTWMFEGSTLASLHRANGQVITESNLSTPDNWQTEQPINFSTTFEFDAVDANLGYISIEKSNPSGIPNNGETYTFPLSFN